MSRGNYGNHTRIAGFVDQVQLKRLSLEFDETCRGLAAQAKAGTDKGYFATAVEPVWKAWLTFRKSAGESIDAVSYELWRHKLDVIRAGAKVFGLRTPPSLATVGLVGGGVVLLCAIAFASRRS